jgi:iron complex outermembrane receptor protein
MNHQVKKRTGRGGVSCIARRKRSFNTLVIFFLLFVAALLFVGTTSAEAMEMDFNIPAQTLSSALKTFAEDTGLQMLYSSDTVKGIRSSRVNGKHQPKEALDILLGNTGLSFKFTDSNTVVVQKNEGRKGKKLVAQREGEEKEEAKRPVEMEQMTVTATKTPINVREVPASVRVVTSEDIKLRARTDNYYDALRSVPGVFVKKAGFQDDIYLRGKFPSIMVNGRDMNTFLTSGSLITSSMNVGTGAIERIEVLKGPQGAIYGSKAVSGVVNVILKKGDKDNPYVEMRGFYGEGDELSGGLSLSGGYDKLSYFLDLYSAQQNEYETPEGDIPFMDYERKNVYSRFDYAFSDDHELTLEYTYNDSENTMGGEGYFYKPSAWSAIYSHEPKNSGVFLTYNGEFSDWFSLYAFIGTQENEWQLIYGRPNDEPEHFLNKENETNYEEDILQGELRGTLNLLSDNRLRIIGGMHLLSDNRLRIIGGMQYKQSDTDLYGEKTSGGIKAVSYDYDGKEEFWAPYAQVEFRPIPHALMVAGIRYDNYETGEKDMSRTSPNVGLSLFPFAHTDYNWTTIWGSYSESFNTPNSVQYFSPWGNPDLKPEEAEGWEVGLKQRISQWANLDFSYFETDYDNLIKFSLVDPDNYIWQLRNVDKAKYEGCELLAEVYPADWLTLHFGFRQKR